MPPEAGAEALIRRGVFQRSKETAVLFHAVDCASVEDVMSQASQVHVESFKHFCQRMVLAPLGKQVCKLVLRSNLTGPCSRHGHDVPLR